MAFKIFAVNQSLGIAACGEGEGEPEGTGWGLTLTVMVSEAHSPVLLFVTL